MIYGTWNIPMRNLMSRMGLLLMVSDLPSVKLLPTGGREVPVERLASNLSVWNSVAESVNTKGLWTLTVTPIVSPDNGRTWNKLLLPRAVTLCMSQQKSLFEETAEHVLLLGVVLISNLAFTVKWSPSWIRDKRLYDALLVPICLAE